MFFGCLFYHLSLLTAAHAKSLRGIRLESAPNMRQKRSTACYGTLGCFSNGPPFLSQYRPIPFLPQSPDEIGTQFHVFSRQDRRGTSFSAKTLDSFRNTSFSADRPTKFIVHGWQGSTGPKYNDMKSALLTKGDYNVIFVSWSEGAKTLYGQATANTRIVGAQIALLIRHLQTSAGASAKDMHIIGHSLGAHIAGYAGERTPELARITALDPAEPYFQHTDPVVRLDPTDAAFVDVIHTDAASFYSSDVGLGMSQPCGHADFYPNGGFSQPGCSHNVISVLESLLQLFYEKEESLVCSHARSVYLFTDSIRNSGRCPYRAYRCDSGDHFNSGRCIVCNGSGCWIMGFNADDVKPAGGATNVKYFVNTGASPSYCRFHYSVTFIFSSGVGDTKRGKLYLQLFGSTGDTVVMEATEEPVYIEPGSSHTFIMTSPEGGGLVRKVNFRWVHDATLWDPGTWYLPWNTPAVHLKAIVIYSGETQKGESFCAGDATVNSDSGFVFNRRC